MKALVATSRGGLRVIGFNNSHSIDVSGDICPEPEDPVRQVLRYEDDRGYLVVLRRSGVIQLYESLDYERYRMVKEWKNNCYGLRDQVLTIGILDNQYLYSCSRDGKLIVRDLVHDDEELRSYKCYKLGGPIVHINIKSLDGTLHIATSGKSTAVKVYSISLQSGCADYQADDGGGKSTIRSVSELRNALRAPKDKGTVTPSWQAKDDHWIAVIEWNPQPQTPCQDLMQDPLQLVFCGTQFGEIVVYHRQQKTPLKTFKVSSMPIKALRLHRGRLYYTDLVSKFGHIDWATLENSVAEIKFGPAECLKMDFTDNSIRLIVSTLLGNFNVYEIRNMRLATKFKLKFDCIITDFTMLNTQPYKRARR